MRTAGTPGRPFQGLFTREEWGSARQLGDGFAAVHEFHRAAPWSGVFGLEVDPHGLGHGGDNIHHADGPIDDVDTVLIRGADRLASLEATTAHDDRPAPRPVI